MTQQDHIQGVGAIVTNLQSLETVIRIFLARVHDQRWKMPGPVDQLIDESYLTNFRALGPLIDQYNGLLSDNEQEFKVDRKAVDIRDAFAHGRLLSVGDIFPATLYKFGIAQDGKVPVMFQQVLTTDWLNSTKLMLRDEQLKVVNCHKARGYKGF